jgi:uncharacterized protein YuzE
MNEMNQLLIPATARPTVEIDNASHSVYIRFKRAKVQKTLSDNRRHAVLTIDLDAKGEVIGIELVGIQNLTISQIRRVLPERLRGIDFDQARWVPTGFRESTPVAA